MVRILPPGNGHSPSSPSHSGSPRSGGSSSGSSGLSQSLFTILRACALSMASLYVGFYLGFKEGVAQTSRILSENAQREAQQNQAPIVPVTTAPVDSQTYHIFPKATKAFVAGMSVVDRKEFAYKFDTGVPLFPNTELNNQVILLHARSAMPVNSSFTKVNHISVDQATENCNYMSLILTQPERHDQCIAIMGQFNSYHVHKFMRTPDKKPGQVNRSLPLKLVRRGTDFRSFSTQTPSPEITRKYWELTLQPYLTNLQTYLDKLRPIAEKIAVKNTVIVMVSNHGQSEMLMNFVCHAKQYNHDLSMVLMFATDLETYHLSQSLGLTTFYDEQLFAQIPKKHAAKFGDSTYKMAIFSKLYCVHLIGMLGYTYLFQDVDIIWYKHPLQFFHQAKLPFRNDYDMYMQNDGNYANFYMPYSGNTGFYFVRNTPRTQYFMNQFLVSGDLILATSTHQAPFISVLSEHASLHGLRVKILPGDDFPGGMQYQQKKQYMQYLMKAVPVPANVHIDPWIFHMSWTLNKDSKIQFFQQMGAWHVNDSCLPGSATSDNLDAADPSVDQCCSAKPIIRCHYRDVPSIIPCHDSPPHENKRASWYPKG